MCGRVIVKTSLAGILSVFANARRTEDVEAMANAFPRYNGAPSLEYPIIIWEPDVAGPVFARARWGFVPRWSREQSGRPPINARSESVASNGMFKDAYRLRRALMPIDGYFEWRATVGAKAKQPYAIAMEPDHPFCVAAIWESRRDPKTGLEEKTFAVLTCVPNDLVGTIHDRMPVILAPEDHARWLSGEPDPRDLLKPYPAEKMRIWPVSSKVGSPRNDTPDIIDPIELEPTNLFE